MSESEQAPPKPRRPVPVWVWPTALIVLAFLLRLIGITWGLPNALHNQTYHPDEYLLMSYVSQLDLGHGIWNPHFYNYGSLWLYIMSLAIKVATGWGLVSPASMAGAHLACRVVSALLGSLTVGLTYFIGRRIGGLAGGLTAGIALLISPGHLVHSRFHTVDVPATFFVTAALLLALKTYEAKSDRSARSLFLWGSALAGLAAATKYNMILVELPLIIALMMRKWNWPVGLLGIVCLAAAFFVTTPGALLDNGKFMQDLSFEAQHVREGHGLVFAQTPNAWPFQFGNLIEAVGLGVPLVAIVGLFYAIQRKEKTALLLLAFAVPYTIMICGIPGIYEVNVKFLRYILPLTPIACAYAGYMLSLGLRETLVESRAAVAAGAILVFSVIGGINFSVVTELMSKEDPRDRAALWLSQNANGHSIGFTTVPWFYTPPLFQDTGAGFGVLGAIERLKEMSQIADFRLLYYSTVQARVSDWDPKLISELRPDYVVYSSYEDVDADRVRLPGYVSTKHMLDEQYVLVAQFGYAYLIDSNGEYQHRMSHDMMYIAPGIRVWKRK